MSKKIFVNNINTFVSTAILEEITKDIVEDPEEDDGGERPIIFGTYIDKDSTDRPNFVKGGIKKMLKRSKPLLAMKYLADCDLIIVDLHKGDPNDYKLVLDALKKHKTDEGEEKVFILISSLMAWQGTPKKLEELGAVKKEKKTAEGEGEKPEGEEAEKKEDEDEEPQKDADDEDAEQKSESSIGEFKELPPKEKIRKKFKHIAFTEKDYKLRDPIEEYRIIKDIEDEVLNFKKEGVKTYVISAGILYGKGEAIFNSHFQKAWLQDPIRLPYVGDGNNLVPTIHVTDLARIVLKVFEKKPERQYIFAVDNNNKPT